MLLLIILNVTIAKIKKESAVKLILEHIFLALFVIVVSGYIGSLVAKWIK